MRAGGIALLALLPALALAQGGGAAVEDLTTLPLGRGLPVAVRVGLYFVEVASVDENDGAFTATVDLRVRWVDSRLTYPKESVPNGWKELQLAAAEARLAEIWAPDVQIANLAGEPEYQVRGLRLYPDGRVELIQRTKAQFTTSFDVERFPFDRQKLQIELVSRRDNTGLVALDFRQDELDFTRLAEGVDIEGWTAGLTDMKREPQPGWYGREHAGLFVALEVERQPGNAVAAIFIPLLASLLIPLLAMWLNKVEDGTFQIEAFELANIIIGGLFAVIALNFTVNSEYTMLGSADNTVSRLFALNYMTLGISLVTNITLFRFNLVQRLFGKYVQEALYLYLAWAVPLLALVSATAIILVALV